MGDIYFLCPSCSKQLVIEDQAAGLGIHCPKCNHPVRVPSTPAPEADDPPAATTDEPCTVIAAEAVREGDLVICKGTIRNDGELPEAFVKAEIDWLDDDGNVTSSDWTFAISAGELQPGETTQFAFSTESESHLPGYRLRVSRG